MDSLTCGRGVLGAARESGCYKPWSVGRHGGRTDRPVMTGADDRPERAAAHARTLSVARRVRSGLSFVLSIPSLESGGVARSVAELRRRKFPPGRCRPS
jgi:hypothetical protein